MLLAGPPFGQRFAGRFLAGSGLFDLIEHASDVSGSTREAGIVSLLLKQTYGQKHHLRIALGRNGDEALGIFQRAHALSRVCWQASTRARYTAAFRGASGYLRRYALQVADERSRCRSPSQRAPFRGPPLPGTLFDCEEREGLESCACAAEPLAIQAAAQSARMATRINRYFTASSELSDPWR